MRKALLLTLLLYSSASGELYKPIEQAYQRSSRAMALKFVDGVHSIRDRNFELLDPDGTPVPLPVERARLEQLLLPALRIEESHRVVQSDSSPSQVDCRVRFTTRVRLLDTAKRKPFELKMDTECQDRWVLRGQEWKLLRSQVLLQESSRSQAP